MLFFYWEFYPIQISAINKQKEPENTYLQISEKPAWALLKKWKEVSPDFAYYTFRHACGLEPCEQNATFKSYAASRSWEISDLIPEAKYLTLADLDLSIGSQFVGHYSEYISSEKIIIFGYFKRTLPISFNSSFV